MIVVKGNSKLLREYFGKVPPYSVKAVVAVDNDNDNRPIGVAGVRPIPEGLLMFSDISDELREHSMFKRIIVKAYRELFKMLPDLPVYSVADEDIEGSVDLLEHLGFEKRGNVWRF